ncbi:putative ribosome biogenesis GTPase RsgA 2 [Neiella marina]|uniref:Small ribosomal subunit biogenesis GTPase RsgA n=1 Tax=Neiella marina TaxID=508461 RepID=A0A8J2U3M7_9GAMM|nr:ribosome small subunit-dependent GTPase A [Neiella marina]GGA71072.1 putative ribosome biogenesis GTPase RsgA 2 [Neiella marina]
MNSSILRNQLGWQPFFQQQLALEEYQDTIFARIVAHHRSEYLLLSESFPAVKPIHHLPISNQLPELTVGDWVLLDRQLGFVRRLERKSLFRRKAAGPKIKTQLIAANIDTVFIMSSVNHDFNLSRIERYLALAHEAQVEPVVVLTKQDLSDNSEQKRYQVQQLDSMLAVESINALDSISCECLNYWNRPGQTLALLGSSGVGKSTLANTLMGQSAQLTGAIRQDDSKGRHTTTARTMHLLPSGAVLVDTPGMRELQLTDCEQGVMQAFADVDALAQQCRFSDCRHNGEPGCAIQQAIDSGALEQRRFDNFIKLLTEQARNSATLAQLRAKDKAFGKMVKTVGAVSRQIKKGF